MDILKAVLVFVGAVIVGMALGFAINYVISKLRKPQIVPVASQAQAVPKTPTQETTATPLKTQTNVAPQRKESLEALLENHKNSQPVVKKPAPATQQKSKTSPAPAVKSLPVAEQKPKVSVTPAAIKPATVADLKPKTSTEHVSTKSAPVVEQKPKLSTEPAPIKLGIAAEQGTKESSALFKEVVLNFTIATAPWSGKVSAFQTETWEKENSTNEPFLEGLQQDITQAYVDMHLANSIVWLSNEVGHHSPEVDESYKQLCIKISERLKKVIMTLQNVK